MCCVEARLKDLRPRLDQLRERFHPERDVLMRSVQFLIAVALMPVAGEGAQ